MTGTAPRRMCGFVPLVPALSGRHINQQPLSTGERQNKPMHPTADTIDFIFGNCSGRRVMPGARRLRPALVGAGFPGRRR
jgi:hypothetical protein